ncbi:hypothetical protein D3C81_1720860 [compost metagenome]
MADANQRDGGVSSFPRGDEGDDEEQERRDREHRLVRVLLRISRYRGLYRVQRRISTVDSYPGTGSD